jgi:hypothetical protein
VRILEEAALLILAQFANFQIEVIEERKVKLIEDARRAVKILLEGLQSLLPEGKMFVLSTTIEIAKENFEAFLTKKGVIGKKFGSSRIRRFLPLEEFIDGLSLEEVESILSRLSKLSKVPLEQWLKDE